MEKCERPISYKRHRFPAEVIRHVVWLYFRFTLSFRDVEELLAQRGIEVSYETIRCWTQKFGRLFAHNLRRSRPRPTARWRLDEMVVKIGGKKRFLWRAVDDVGVVLDMLVQERRNGGATPTGWDAGEQSGREFAPVDPSPGAKAAEVQVPGLSPEVPRHPRRRLRHLQSQAPPDPSAHPSPVPGRGPSYVGGCDCRCVITAPGRGLLRLGRVNLTKP